MPLCGLTDCYGLKVVFCLDLLTSLRNGLAFFSVALFTSYW